MSFGDPNNPYGQPQQPQGQQPGYGYPQQQPGYGYPQQAPQGGPMYGGGFTPMEMPSGVKAARVMLFILGGLQAIGGVIMMAASAWFSELMADSGNTQGLNSEDIDTVSGVGAGIMIFFGVIMIGVALWAILTAAKFGTGRGGIRVSAIIYASILTLLSVFSLLTMNIFALISLALGIMIIVFCANTAGGQWFNRPRG
ncbi:hypothetical protein [Streptomyces sp. NPDC051561]|uniref:hypothetical protein n=1 Tax=Streptomyces sp. NPDC051561 TaxID=3365658 RepID=UPI0037AA1226